MNSVYLVLPAVTEMAGQLRIVYQVGVDQGRALSDYREHPDNWMEVGLVSAHDGRLVCLDASPDVWQSFRESEPIRPPLVVTSDKFNATYVSRVARRLKLAYGRRSARVRACMHAQNYESSQGGFRFWSQVDQAVKELP